MCKKAAHFPAPPIKNIPPPQTRPGQTASPARSGFAPVAVDKAAFRTRAAALLGDKKAPHCAGL